jgi:crotonobetainyl-CoA:carnitine CoA-transferase CaiB-like acyl-CoA transferase
MDPLLSKVRILDLTRMLTGDYAAMLMGDLGAEVIKVETPGTGDPLRKMPPHFLEGESAYFLSINRNKKSIILDLKNPDDKAKFYKLVKKIDVVFDNFRPGILEKLGADYNTLKQHNPKIICCSISSYGKTGPYNEQPGFDLVLQALSGSMSITGEEGRAPVRMGIPMGDLAGSMFAVFSIVSALYRREQTGEGANIDISLLDSLVSMLTYVAQYYFIGNQISNPIGSGHMSVVPYRAYEVKDGHIVIAVFVEKFWEILCNVVGEPELGSDERYNSTAKRLENREKVDKLLEDKFRTKTKAEWIKLLHEAGVPAAPVNRIDEVFKDPQVLARDMLVEIDHPKCGKYNMIGNPVKVDGIKNEFRPSPLLGEHTDEVLDELLKSDKEE